MRPAPRAGVIAVVGGLLIAVIAAGYLQASALAVPSAPASARLPAPVIVQYPANPTYATTALFTFTDADWPDVTFHCYLGEPPARPCTRSSAPPVRHRIGKPRKANKSKKHKHRKHHKASHHRGKQHKPLKQRRDISAVRVEGEQRYSGLTVGLYCFFVYATDKAGARSRTSQYCWEVQGHPPPYPPPHPRPPHPSPSPSPSPSLLGLTIGGNLSTPLFPGTSESLDLTFTNPNSVPMTIPSGNLAAANITVTTTQAGCPNSDFEVVQGLTASVTIPANQAIAISLADLSIPTGDWPVIEMLETGTNQDACEGAPLTLTYSGIEASG
jgi:hypothetical protein